MRRIVLGLGLVAVMTGALAIGSAGAAGRHAVAAPNRGLTDGQVITVSWSGFAPPANGGGILIEQCNSDYHANPATFHCSLYNIGGGAWAASGSVQYTVHAGTIADGTCGASKTDRKCAIWVSGRTTHGTVWGHNSAVASITFARPA